jgi:glucuronosyltransferase
MNFRISSTATPMYGDQRLNAAALKNRGMGTILNYENLNADTLYEALKTALEPSSLENARKVSYSFKNRLRGPSETAVFWAEYVAATGGAPLTHSHSIELSWFVYHSVDVYLSLLVGILVMTYSWIWFVRKICCSGKSKKSAKLKAN